MNINQYITPEVIEKLKAAIEEADSNEVFFTGKLNEKGLVVDVKIGSRGCKDTVPLNFSDVREGEVLIHNHPSGNLTPSRADLGVASEVSNHGKGFYIINNLASDIYVVVEAVLPKKIQKLSEDDAGFFISEGGPLSKFYNGFEERPVQIELLKEIVKAFNTNKIGVFEAGTGVGKSYAYLIPSILWAVNNHERVVISTGTINLQQQICEKDIPAVEKILGKKIKFVLMKGRQNYICKRRLNDAASILDLFENESEELKEISEWALKTENGSKSDLSFMPGENVWSKVNSESDACMGMRCPFHSECFVMKMRKEAASANIIVVNHHLLFADIQSRLGGVGFEDAAVLPPYKHIIFDESHGIENAATSFFSESLTRFKINKLLNQMYRHRKNSESGHLCSLAILSSNEEEASKAYDVTNRIKNSLLNSEIAAKDLLVNESTKRLYDISARDFSPLLVSISELAKALSDFTGIVRTVMDGIEEDDHDAPCYWESKIILRHLEDYILLLKNFSVWDEKRNDVFWIQKKRLPPDMVKDGADAEYISFNQTPLDISELMNEGVFEQMNSVICTSATIKTGRDYNFWMRRIGLLFSPQERLVCRDFPSPFPYKKNMLFAVPSDAPLPEKIEYQQYVEMAIPRLISAAEGRTLVLFTSYESLRSAYNAACFSLRGMKGRLMKQGDDDSSKLLAAFKNENESVLFATDSFWQGVDVPGESLSQVIIVKLPFTVPNDPVFVARAEMIEKRGGNSFMELSIPEAIIKYRQGIGRLIRRSDDRGAVVVLDRRIYEKRYGSFFVNAMPECKKMYAPLKELCTSINEFIFS
ncbi:MAG: DEAD/DEAH box helicase family protein [Treponema sp.]|nr:DEAD/DEAH box helicase family protein [Treponema sp.]